MFEDSSLELERKMSAPLSPAEYKTTQKIVMSPIKGIKSCSDSQLSMIKRFSSESGMYPEWAKK